MNYIPLENGQIDRKKQKSETSPIWIITPQKNRRARLRLFCFHYAGGGASIYRTWPDDLPASIEVCAVQLPGREKLLIEPAFTHLAPLRERLAAVIRPYLDIPFSFFGHSLGALVAFELTHDLVRFQNLSPVRLLVSGRGAPQMPDQDPPIHQLPDDEFVEALRHLGGTPEEILRNAEIMELMLPTLRADFAVSETHIYTPGSPLDCPLSAFGGQDDSTVTYEELEGWREQTRGDFQLRVLPGNHFFLHSSRARLLHAITQDLTPYLS